MTPAPIVIRELIELGRIGRPGIPASLPDAAAWEAFYRGPTSWVTLGQALRQDELEHLIRGLILYCRASGHRTSAIFSPVVTLFWKLRWRYPEREAALGAWIVKHRTSPYEPHGVLDEEGSATWEEYQARQVHSVRAALDQPVRRVRSAPVKRNQRTAVRRTRKTNARN